MNELPSPTFLALQGALAGRYALERELGRGGMGVVYLARDLSLDRPVAIKLLPPSLAQVPSLRERFLREARTAARLAHPNIVPIHSVEEHGEFVLFVMGYIEGETLGQRIARGGPLSTDDAVRIFQEVSWALAYAHRHGVVHRDVKPDNLLLERASGRALVSDFGIAHVQNAGDRTGPGEIVGTARFMSPEQLNGGPLDGRSDLYSLGVTALQALHGDLSPRLEPIIRRCIEADPNARFEDGEALAEALGSVRGQSVVVPLPVERFVDLYKTLSIETASSAALLTVLAAETIIAINYPSSAVFGILLTWGFFIALGLGVLRGIQLVRGARALLLEGFGIDDVRRALTRPDANRRMLPSGSPAGGAPWGPWLRALVRGAVAFGAAMLWAFAFNWQMSINVGTVLNGLILAAFTLVPAAVVRNGLARLFRPGGSGWMAKLWWKILDWKFFKVARIGLGRPAIGASEPTEVMLGAGAQELFNALPPEVRARFSDIPGVLGQLAQQAQRLRESLEAGAPQRLTSTLAAMEQLRLDLLRLRTAPAGDLTNDLNAARQIGNRIEDLLRAQKELDDPSPVPGV